MIKVSDIAQLLGGYVQGDENISVENIASVLTAKQNDAAIVFAKKDEKVLSETLAAVIIGPEKITEYQAKAHIIVSKLDVEKLNQLLRSHKVTKYHLTDQGNTSTLPDVYIGKHCSIGQNCFFAPGVKIMNGVTIGDNVAINANTVIKEGTCIGNNVTIDTNNSIGNFSFEYMAGKRDRYERVESIGRVIIEDNVEIGCNNTIDRGTLGNTVIGRGTKIDNLVQIGHDCLLGAHCLIVSQVGLAGHTHLGNNVIVHGQVGTAGNISIGDNSVIKAKSGVSHSFPNNSDLFGYPAKDSREYFKGLATINKLTKLFERQRINDKSSAQPQPHGQRSPNLFQRLFGHKQSDSAI